MTTNYGKPNYAQPAVEIDEGIREDANYASKYGLLSTAISGRARSDG